MPFPFHKQQSLMDCGPACLHMINQFHGGKAGYADIRHYIQLGKEGANLYGLSDAAEQLGFRSLSVQISYEKLVKEAPLPCIVHWEQNHFVVVTPNANGRHVEVADPANGIVKYSKAEFCGKWLEGAENGSQGIALLLEPSATFHQQSAAGRGKLSWGFLWQYAVQYRRYFFQIILGLLIGSLLQVVLPFLTQSIVDVGINTRNLHYIYLISFAQLFLFAGRTVTDFIRGHLLLFIGTRINISILSDFWIKLMKLPVAYFDTKKTGDTLQRIGDHARLQNFLTASSLNTLFSLVNLLVFSAVLFSYSGAVFGIFMVGSILYFGWISLFLKRRRKLDTMRFSLAGKENTATMQLIQGMQEIRLNNCEKPKRWEWEKLQAGLFQLNFKSLYLSQYQQAGAFFINESKNLVITFLVAKAVINGQLTLGAMLAVQYIIGQLNSPIEQLIGFVQQAQDAKISLERLNEVHQLRDEDEGMDGVLRQDVDRSAEEGRFPIQKHENSNSALSTAELFELGGRSIVLTDVSFTYTGAGNEPVLSNVTLQIPAGKVTAIVGMSGSGKTTLLKLLLRFYDDFTGKIALAAVSGKQEQAFKQISAAYWRKHCASVMQDGYIFNDTIANNICLTGEKPDAVRLQEACRIANVLEFIEALPMGFNTKIGAEGNGVSQGQRQRILIARAVYRNPDYLFFDEATNALDANNEKAILQNLQTFFEGRTVVVVAHRLSTVRHADKIVVLQHGQVVEQGTHEELAAQRGSYFALVKNQLELGN
ncbi:MAG: peptidase domain-containing ABC transporter [Bacteroidetes bacterium]|nr:MAG: peptidase domain-containing ABC transporter [Bacteroidota bacterium]